MLGAPVRWLLKNLSILLLAFALALIVWVAAVVTSDPNERQTTEPISIDFTGQDPKLLLTGNVTNRARLTMEAPRSLWNRIEQNPDLLKAWVDLSGLPAGQHTVPVKASVNLSPVRVIKVEPEELQLTLEPLLSRDIPVELTVSGEVPLGYHKGDPQVNPTSVTVSGPASSVAKVARAQAFLGISGATNTIQESVPVRALDKDSVILPDVTILPAEITVTQPIDLLGGFKNVAVKVVTTGQVANGYRLTNISVSPPAVTVFSDNPQLVNDLPGYVETLPVDLTNLSDDIEINVGLNLPEGIQLVREPNVLVQVSLAAIEGSMTLSLPIETVGLPPELGANISPESVDVIVAGPLNILDTLTPSSFRVILDLTGLPPGIYQRTPVVDLAPEEVRVQTTLPETVEVEIFPTLTPTPTMTIPGSPTRTPTPRLTPTLTPSP